MEGVSESSPSEALARINVLTDLPSSCARREDISLLWGERFMPKDSFRVLLRKISISPGSLRSSADSPKLEALLFLFFFFWILYRRGVRPKTLLIRLLRGERSFAEILSVFYFGNTSIFPSPSLKEG